MQPADVVAQEAAVIELGAQHAGLIVSRHRVCVDAQALAQVLGLARQPVIVGRRRRAGKTARELKVARNLLARDEGGKIFARGLGFVRERERPGLAEFAPQLLVARPQVAAGNATVAGRGPFAGALTIENLHRASGPRQRGPALRPV
jgi:hypothetical protein